jgi:hypothetical protein
MRQKYIIEPAFGMARVTIARGNTVADLHGLLTRLRRPLSQALQQRAASARRRADKRRENNRQACAPLTVLIQLSAERLLMTGEEWRRGPVSGENIALLEQYGRDLTGWCASNSLPIEGNIAALLEHVRSYSACLHTVVQHLRELPVAEHKAALVARLNVCQMKLELELQAVNRYVAELTT